MKIIANIVESMDDELHDAKHRIKSALCHKTEYPEISKREYEIAIQELSHAEKDHASAVELITAYKKTRGDAPEFMQKMWDYEHKKYMEKYAHIKYLIDMYKS